MNESLEIKTLVKWIDELRKENSLLKKEVDFLHEYMLQDYKPTSHDDIQEKMLKQAEVAFIGADYGDKHSAVMMSNCFHNAGIISLYDLLDKTENDLLGIKNFGRKSLANVKRFLTDYGLTLRGENGKA